MLVANDNTIGGFCCDLMEEHSRKPLKAVSFDPWYKKYDNDPVRFAAVIYAQEKAGLAVDQGWETGRSGKAGYQMIEINYCPWCSKKIEFR